MICYDRKQGDKCMKTAKGFFGYVDYEKKKRFITTLLLFLVPLLIFFIGLKITGGRKNVFTVVAVVGCLPGCKSLLGFIMMLKQKSITKKSYESISQHGKNLEMCYELFITGYEKSIFLDGLAICGNTIVGYASQPNADTKFCEEYIEKIVRHNGYKVDVKVLADENKFLERLDSMSMHKESLEKDLNCNQSIRKIILAISL